jgi:hypothetical protein
MKKRYALYSLLLIPALFLLVAFSGGAPEARTGSPLDGNNCTICHTGTAIQAENWISTNIPPEGWEPGNTYTITVTVIDLIAERYGFEITSETGTEKTGTWVITDATRTQLTGSAFVTHTLAGTAPVGNPNSWTVDWTSPASGTGTVGFYAAVNVTNNNSSTSGDDIFVTMLSVPESTIGIAENQLQTKVEVYPNPATTQLNMTLPVNSEIRIFDNNGREVMHRTSSNETEVFDVSTLVNGMYFVHVMNNGQTASRSIIVR